MQKPSLRIVPRPQEEKVSCSIFPAVDWDVFIEYFNTVSSNGAYGPDRGRAIGRFVIYFSSQCHAAGSSMVVTQQ